MPDIKELLPFLIPLIIVQFVLLAFTLRHILTHDTYKRGSRTLWVIVSLIGMEFIGPILYFLLGKEDS
ncbi:MAG: PLDc N-terminal domain-containing protein [Lachnospiraceae bacterium]|nr:PLDc N-terminal domain-containing protein [Lachnospiraceae bacterium]